jgi:hypothetical protein
MVIGEILRSIPALGKQHAWLCAKKETLKTSPRLRCCPVRPSHAAVQQLDGLALESWINFAEWINKLSSTGGSQNSGRRKLGSESRGRQKAGQ